MNAVVEYFVRHYTLVLDNDQASYDDIREAVQTITRDSDVTKAQYLAMSETERMGAFGSAIGERVLDMIGEWYNAALTGRENSLGGSLIREIMIESDSDIAWALARHYMPEDSEADEFFADDETADDESDDDK
jgi:hypothetical protein